MQDVSKIQNAVFMCVWERETEQERDGEASISVLPLSMYTVPSSELVIPFGWSRSSKCSYIFIAVFCVQSFLELLFSFKLEYLEY